MGEWQDIVSAPIDGRAVLVGKAPGKWPGWVDIARWRDDGPEGAGWYGSDTDRDGDPVSIDPTHWQPAPEPPTC